MYSEENVQFPFYAATDLYVAAPEAICHECGGPLSELEQQLEHLVEMHLCSACFKKNHSH